ncbi:MAG: sodium:proton antiporter NhaD [Saprospiraceae bacterium]|nr:sodium:proton antiporter NhaD [Saprospiraceae bacterium]
MITLITAIFIIGYLCIIFEHQLKIDKAVSAMLTGVACWVVIALNHDHVQSPDYLMEQMSHVLGEIAAILFFLLGAMTIVELIDLHDGFSVVSKWIQARKKMSLLILISAISFFFSAVLDNLTTTIVMISLIRKIIHHNEDRLWFVSFVVVAANAGGAWSPIGDVTTTMLWIGHKVTSIELVKQLLIPSLICICIPLMIVSRNTRFWGSYKDEIEMPSVFHPSASFYLITGVILLIFVPVFKTITHLPPFMGMMGALSIFWLISEIDHPYKFPETKESPRPTVRNALSRIEIPSILFFFGILLAIAALQHIGQLIILGNALDRHISDPALIAFVLGLLSAVIDNVPLVAGAMGMYSYPVDHNFWHEVAFAAGTGGSVLIIGSAAGVAAMGLEKITYPWYLKRISVLAFLGYVAGWLYIYFFD